mmetsp:Transcript_15672/g.26277  ORF Transcript_15672/g.26277 Transcript_15672/m.26277 type:complete len:535 (-) Transcript_15672:219-1823(-)
MYSTMSQLVMKLRSGVPRSPTYHSNLGEIRDEYEESEGEDLEDEDYVYSEGDPQSEPCSPCPQYIKRELYQIMNYDDITKKMKASVANIAALLDITTDEATVLLQYMRWNEEKVMEAYFSNPEKLRLNAGINLFQVASKDNIQFTCKICYDDNCQSPFSLGCGHRYCEDCFGHYLRSKFDEGPVGILTNCPHQKCNQKVTPSCFSSLLSPEHFATYDRLAVTQFLEASKSYKYCPGPNCDRIVASTGATQIDCNHCGHSFCFQCTRDDHRPCACATLVRWEDKCRDESETANWMMVNTKKCSKCLTNIEKNQGCNHMTCRQCRHEFCWICGKDWRGHSSCNRFEADADALRKKSKADLDRYMHYYKRYQNHEIALRLAIEQRVRLEEQLNYIASQAPLQGYSEDNDMRFLRDAADQVIKCRRILMYTYVMGYFLPDSARNKQLFERHQEMLEVYTERLHEFAETKDLSLLDRVEVANYTATVERFRQSLLYDIHDDEIIAHAAAASSSSSSSSNSSRATISSSSIRVTEGLKTT